MFETRLNPTKPPAAHRAILERVGAACRELRPIEEACYLQRQPNTQIAAILARHKVLGLGIPEEFEGVGTDALLCAMAAERIGREGAGPGGFFTSHSIQGAGTVARWGTPEQKGLYLPRAARGECLFGFALWQASLDSNFGSVNVTFQATSSGFILTGQERWVSNAVGGGALITFARSRPDGRVSAFLVEGSTSGVRIDPVAHKVGLPTEVHSDIWFEDCEVPRESLLGELGQGVGVARSALIGGWLSMAGVAVGVIADCLEESLAWATSDKRRGKELSGAGLLDRHIAEMGVDLEAARGLVYAAAELKSEYDRRPASRHLELETQTIVSEAKYFASRAAYRAAYSAIQSCGQDGYLLTSRPARHLCDTRAAMLDQGGDEMLEGQIARYYLDRS